MGNTAKFIFWDVQHGHATYINTPNDRHIVVDLGTGSYQHFRDSFSPLKHLKEKYGVRKIDYLVITHPHKDHIDDILNVQTMRPKILARPKHLNKDEVMKDAREKDKPIYEEYFRLSESYSGGIEDNNPNDPYTPSNWGGMIINSFRTTNCPNSNINNHSLIRVFEYADSKIIVPGDNEECSLKKLMENKEFTETVKDSDVLLAPHHGRKAGFYNEFVKLVNPRLTVVSDGRFGDTSYTSAYGTLSRGWKVHKRSGGSEERKVITTRRDGLISIKFGHGNEKPFIAVKID